MARLLWGAVCAAALALAGCGGGGDLDNELALRVIHASPDAPAVNLLIDAAVVRAAVDYKSGTGYIYLTPRTYQLGIEALLPQGNLTVLDEARALAAGTQFTALVVGKAGDDTLDWLRIDRPFEPIPSGRLRVEIVHAAPDAPLVNVTLVSATAGAVPALQTALSYKGTSGRQLIDPAGDYIVEISLAADPDAVLFRASSLSLNAGRDLLFVVVANTATGPSPVSLVLNDGFVNGEILDAGTTSDLRVIHAAPDAPALDVIADPAVEADPEITLADAVGYLDVTAYQSLPPANYTIRGVLDSDPSPQTPPFTTTRSLLRGQRGTLLATGLRGSTPPSFDDLVLVDLIRPVALYGKVRVIDAAPAGAVVDVYVKTTGTDIATVDATLRNLGLRGSTAHLAFSPGNYTLTVTTAGTKTVLATADLGQIRGRVLSVVLVDEVRIDETDDGLPLGVLVIEDTL